VSVSGLLDNCRKVAAEFERERNLRGVTTAPCTTCNGSGEESPGYDDYDGYGAIWRSATPCPACRGARRFEVPCTAEQEIAAIDHERARLRARHKALGARRVELARKAHGGGGA
jgi:DnaJ-class molecular chaperone